MAGVAHRKRPRQRRRADAERNVAAILDAALELLALHPEASMAEIAAAAGVSRQTVYAHYESRESLLVAAAERALEQTLAAFDAAEPDRGPPAEALDRLVEGWWDHVAGHAQVLDALAVAYPTVKAVHELHAPIIERLMRLIRRGQRTRDFDRRLPPAWLATAFLALMHGAADEVAAGRTDAEEAGRALARSIPRLFGTG